MAWISVHDHVDGGKLRELAKDIGCSQKEALGILVSLWIWGLNNADNTGELRSCDRHDIAEEVLSKGISDGLDKNKIVESLIEKRWVDEVNGTLYLHDWDEWQEQWYKFLKRKEYDSERKRRDRAKKPVEEKPVSKPVETKKTENTDSHMDGHKENPTDVPAERPTDSPPDKKVKKPSKKKVEKKQYADFVTLKEEEYQKLVLNYGQAAADKSIEKLNLYKGANGKTYKSDYMAILNWVMEKIEKDFPGLIRKPAPENQKKSEKPAEVNPFGQWKE